VGVSESIIPSNFRITLPLFCCHN